MKKILTVSLIAISLCATPTLAKVAMAERVFANNARLAAVAPCGMIETAQVSITFNGVEQDATTVKAKFDARVKEIETLFKEAELDKFDMQSMNYSISPQNYGGANSLYQFNGNMSYMVSPSSKATTLMEQLSKKGYQASVSVNAYRSGTPCPQKQ